MRSASRDDDLTARAGIRHAALRLFAERDPDAVSVRRIAEESGVSPALVLHHFGSKQGLREAVDEYVAGQLDDLLVADRPAEIGEAFTEGSPASLAAIFAEVFPGDSPIPGYLRRLLLNGDPAGTKLFRSWFEVTRQLLAQLQDAGLARESEDPDVQAAFLLAADTALLVLREPIAVAVGFDPMSQEGLTRWAAQVADITRHGVFTPTDGKEADSE